MGKIVVAVIVIVLGSFLGYSYALTPDEVIRLKKAGVSDQTIQIMLKQEQEARDRGPCEQMGTREVKDKEGNTYIIYSTGASTIDETEKEKVENAWKMLQNMIIEKKDAKVKK
ncbi:MAG: hypothetical protein ACE14T_05835 [Syntrophales bacterium]